ncbi:MAG TPA: TonB-dependent receptor [Segetibacter sp.]|nr:TonB-dependent receptor [Segetibacter sp.]
MKRHLTIVKNKLSIVNIIFSLLTALFLFTSNYVIAQQISVSGTVTGDNGPLNGASVTVKGSASGTSTDSSGTFTLLAPSTATLVFSSVGYTSKDVAVAGRANITVSLVSSNTQLEQVVVVGYGTQRKRDVTGSVASVKGADIAKQPVLTATQAIQGRVAGVQIITSGQPNALPTVRVRGTGTMLGGANPLYVVDGVITEDIRNINSADIVSLDILKDASATAIYGMRAANGVLLITTKKGRSGKMVVSYDANIGVREATRLVNMAGPNQYANYINEANIYYGSSDSLITGAMLSAGGNTDWYDAVLRKGIQQNHNISVSGGSDKMTYFFSAGYLSDEGIVETNKFNRFTLRSNNEYKFSNAIRLSSLISYSRSDLRDINLDVFNVAYRAAPYVQSKVNDKYGNTSLSNNVGNPLLDLDKTYNQGIGNRLQGTFALDIKPISWLTLRSSLGVDLDFNKNTAYSYQFDNSGPNSVFITQGGNQIRTNSSLGITNNNATRWVWDNTITAAKIFGRHNFNFLIGTTAERYDFNSLNGTRISVPANRDQWYLNAGSNSGGITNENSGDRFTRNSYLSRLNYNYANRYMVTATFRADGTSRFSSTNRWGYFPSIGLGWDIAKEAFMSDQETFSTLRLRGSWGRVGNDQIPTSSYLPLATINVPYFFDQPGGQYLGISFDQLSNRDVKWEVTNEVDVGLDYGFLKGKLTGEIDFYKKTTKDALVNVNIPGILGDKDNQYITNAANFENTGVEFSINWNDNINRDWSYNIGGNIAYNKNQILGLNGGQALFAGSVGGFFTTKSDNGQPIGSFFLRQADGIFQTSEEIEASAQPDAKPGDLKYKDVGGADGKPDGKIDDLDRLYNGSYQPKVTFGVNGGVTYKSLDLSINTYGTAGGKIYNGKKAARPDSRDNIETEVAKNRWTPNSPNTSIPRANLSQLPASTYFLEKGDFFRINNLTIGYAVPPSALGNRITNLRVFVTAQNLATITSYSGFTPEIQTAGTATNPGALSAGIELNAYPTTRTFAFGVNVGF